MIGRRQRHARAARLALLAAGIAAGWAPSALCEDNLDVGEMAAALAFPIITGGFQGNPLSQSSGDVVIPAPTASTLITVTNGKSDSIVLKVDAISGDPGGDNWQSLSFDCPLTGRETTTFVFRSNGSGGSNLFVECRDDLFYGTRNVRRFTNVQNGILFVALADSVDRKAASEDVLFGDAIVIDHELGQSYSFSAIPFQAGADQNDGNKLYEFDGGEYAKWPAVVATNFLAPTDSVNAELVLFTLDGMTGTTPAPRVKLGGLAFNDDEEYFDFQYDFDFFDVVSLTDLDPNFLFTTRTGLGLASLSGHVQLKPQPIGTLGHDAHDAAFGDGNNVRKRPVHCWIVQSTDGTYVPEDEPVPGTPRGEVDRDGPLLGPNQAAWGRPCIQSRSALRPFLNDMDPVLAADPSAL